MIIYGDADYKKLSKNEEGLSPHVYMFPTLSTRTGALRSKNSYTPRRPVPLIWEEHPVRGTASAGGADIVRSRATSLRKKAAALNQQEEVY